MPTKILVVDDEPDLKLLIQQKFRKQIKEGRYDFVFAHNGVEALAQLAAHPNVDLVLSDINMPEMDGVELVRAVRRAHDAKSLPIIMITAKSEEAARQEALKLGADIRLPATSALDAASAMTELAKGGLSLRDSMRAARGTLQLAAAAQTDEATAAALTARTLTAFNLAGDKAGDIADNLANAANAATGEISDMALGLQQSAQVANQFGLSAADTVTALTELAKAGLIGSDAGTSLRVMLTRLLPASKQAKQEMQRLGVSVTDAAGNFRPFRDIIDDYNRALAKLTPRQRQSALNIIFGQDAQRAANIIFGQSVSIYDALTKAVTRHGGAARVSAAQMKGFRGAQEAFNSALQTNEILLGTQLLPSLTKYLRQSATWLSDTKNQKKLQKELKDALQTVAGILGDVKSVVQGVNQITGGWKRTLTGLIALKIAPVVFGWVRSIDRFSLAQKTAAAESAVLLTKLRTLAALGAAGIVINLIPRAKPTGNEHNPASAEGNPVSKAFASLPFVGNLFSQVNKFVDEIAKKEGLIGKEGEKAAKRTKTSAVKLFAGLTFAEAKVLNPTLTRKAFDLGQAVAKAFLKGQDDAVAGDKRKPKQGGDAALDGLKRKGISAELRNTIFDNAITRALDRVQDLGIRQQVARLGEIAKLIQQRISATKDITRKLTLEDRLVDVLRERRAAQEQLSEKVQKDLSAKQFRALGLDDLGNELVPSSKKLRSQLLKLDDAVSGTFLDTKKTQSLMSKIRRVLSGGLGAVTKDVRSKIKEMLGDLDQQLKDHNSSGPRTKFQVVNSRKLLAGLGLDPNLIRQIRARLVRVGAGGTVPGTGGGAFGVPIGGGGDVVVHTTIQLDGRTVAVDVTRHQRQSKRANPRGRRGTRDR